MGFGGNQGGRFPRQGGAIGARSGRGDPDGRRQTCRGQIPIAFLPFRHPCPSELEPRASMEPAPLSPASRAGTDGRTHRPWGWFETLAEGEGYRVKRLLLQAGCRISLQRHRHRCEHWVVVRGNGTIECDGRITAADVGHTAFIPVGGLHRASADSEDLEIIEVQRGAILSEEDIERIEDDFGRVVRSFNNL